MFADEADQDGGREYLVYASIFVPGDQAAQLSEDVAAARTSAGLSGSDSLKFATNTRPKSMTSAEHTALKNGVLQLAAEYGVKVCCYLVPHDIARNQDLATKLKYGSNTLLQKFNEFLAEQSDVGIAYFDRTTDYAQHDYLSEVFSLGLDFNGTRRRLPNLICLGTTSNQSSHLSSVCDIVVGACRYAINEPERNIAGAALLRSVARLMWSKAQADGRVSFRERGLCIRPKNRQVQEYEANIQALIDRLNNYLAE